MVAVTGAGKTTLLTALAGRASYGILSGKVTINGR
jgi:Fe-S cluster assembly ATPase SufC